MRSKDTAAGTTDQPATSAGRFVITAILDGDSSQVSTAMSGLIGQLPSTGATFVQASTLGPLPPDHPLASLPTQPTPGDATQPTDDGSVIGSIPPSGSDAPAAGGQPASSDSSTSGAAPAGGTPGTQEPTPDGPSSSPAPTPAPPSDSGSSATFTPPSDDDIRRALTSAISDLRRDGDAAGSRALDFVGQQLFADSWTLQPPAPEASSEPAVAAAATVPPAPTEVNPNAR